MHCWKRVLLGLVAAALMLLAVLAWGSLGSAVCVYCLITMAAGVLFKRFLIERDPNEFDME